MDKLTEEVELNMDCIAESVLPSEPPWLLTRVVIDFSLHNVLKNNVSSDFHQMQFHEYCERNKGFKHLFTDGSKDAVGVASAAVHGSDISSAKLSKYSSIFSAECYAVILGLQLIELSQDDKFIIFSDSLSCLQALCSFKYEHPHILQIIEIINNLNSQNKSVKFCWIPSHMGIKGNEKADEAAKAALLLNIDHSIKISYTDMKSKVTAFYKNLFQTRWNNVQFNKLKNIKDQVGKTTLRGITLRRDEIVLHRARIGHSHITHSHLLNRENAPDCDHCQCPLTVEHILLQCQFFNNIRLKFFTVITLSDLFNKVPNANIIDFLKEIDMYSRF